MKTPDPDGIVKWVRGPRGRGTFPSFGHVVDDLAGLTREEARRRARSKPGLFASLSSEAREYLRNYDGPENMGPAH